MGSLRQGMTLALICVVVLVFSVAAIVAAFATGIELNIDGILLIAIGLMMAGIFGLMLLLMAREQGWIPARAKKEASPAAAAKAAPGSPPGGEKNPAAPQQASGS